MSVREARLRRHRRVRGKIAGTAERLAAHSRWEYDDLPYWGGEVDVCIMNASLNRVTSSRFSAAFWTWIIEAWESAASSLCVEWVAKVIAWRERAGFEDEIAWKPS